MVSRETPIKGPALLYAGPLYVAGLSDDVQETPLSAVTMHCSAVGSLTCPAEG